MNRLVLCAAVGPLILIACGAQEMVPAKPLTSRQILDQAEKRIAAAETLTVTVESFAEEFPRPQKTKWWFRKGGYYRYESPSGTLITSPTKGWSYKPTGKGYMVFPGAQTNWSLASETGLGSFGDPSDMPTIGEPKTVKWHGRSALRVEVDGRKTMTKETKLYYFFDPKTLDHIGISANLGSLTQIAIFSDLQIDPKIDASKFTFIPPPGWKQVNP